MASSFTELIKGSVGKTVRLQRHGPDMAVGVLRHVGDDFIVVEDDDGEVVLYPTGSIHAFGTMTAPEKAEETTRAVPMMQTPIAFPTPDEEEKVDISTFATLSQVLNILPKRLVKIGREGPGSIRGLVLDVGDDYLCIISDIKELIYLNLDAVKSLTLNPGNKSKRSENSSTTWTQWFK